MNRPLWMDGMITVLIREGINKHRAKEIVEVYHDVVETDEALLRQVLDALIRVQPQIRGALPVEDVAVAITALRERLGDKSCGH